MLATYFYNREEKQMATNKICTLILLLQSTSKRVTLLRFSPTEVQELNR